MKWKDVELIDGEFYFVDVARYSDNEPNEWVFVYKENRNCTTEHYCAAKISSKETTFSSIYGIGYLCSESRIAELRRATQEDIKRFFEYLDKWGCRYSLNTKKLRHVGGR